MSYGVIAYIVDLEELNKCFGSANEFQKNTIIDFCKQYAQDIDSWDTEDTPTLLAIAEELLDGNATHSNLGYKYWYALKGFIKASGGICPSNRHWGSEKDAFFDFFHAPNGFEYFSINTSFPIPIADDFPFVSVLKNEKITEKFIAEIKENAYLDKDLLEEATSWIIQAHLLKQDLIVYYH
jgi:hypothetical protein